MRRRMGRPGLVGTMARTAVIAGTATAVAGGVQGRQQAKAQAAANEQAADQASEAEMAAMQAQLDELQAQQAAPAPAAPAGGGDDLMAQLENLASMHQAGVLDDAEFAAAKARLLSA